MDESEINTASHVRLRYLIKSDTKVTEKLHFSCNETDVNEMPFGSGCVKKSVVVIFYLMLPLIIMGFKSSSS